MTVPHDVEIGVKIVLKNGGKYQFIYYMGVAKFKGNLDFNAAGITTPVMIKFTLLNPPSEGFSFITPGRKSMYIGLASNGCPTKEYNGSQFGSFATDGQSLKVLDNNDDGETYQYTLRVQNGGTIYEDDPEIKNKNNGIFPGKNLDDESLRRLFGKLDDIAEIKIKGPIKIKFKD